MTPIARAMLVCRMNGALPTALQQFNTPQAIDVILIGFARYRDNPAIGDKPPTPFLRNQPLLSTSNLIGRGLRGVGAV